MLVLSNIEAHIALAIGAVGCLLINHNTLTERMRVDFSTNTYLDYENFNMNTTAFSCCIHTYFAYVL